MMSSWGMLALAGLLAASQVQQDESVAPVSIQAVAAPSAVGVVRLPAATPIVIEIAESVGSNISRIDDMFAIRVAEPVMIDGKIVLAPGVMGRGQVVHAAKSTGLGKAGELILAARFVECGSLRIPLRGMRLATSGKDKSGEVFALTSVFLPLAFIGGGKVLIPADTHAIARLAQAVDVPTAGCPAPPAAPLPGTSPITAAVQRQ